jgi:phage anti-repressor protein
MTTLTTIKEENRLLVSASDLYAAMRRTKDTYGKDAFRVWLADRIQSLEMEEGYDFFIYLNAESVREMLKYESVSGEVKNFFENYS